MKKVFLTLLLALIAKYNVISASISAASAKEVAINFFKSNATSGLNSKTITAVLSYTKIGNNGNTCFYIFNISPLKGFVIVSGDDLVEPVIGYSMESNFNANFANVGILDWMETASQKINSIIMQRVAKSDRITKSWKAYNQGVVGFKTATMSVDPLLTTTWSQSPYYNMYCPSNSPTGCVATAMAQIMKYWNYPATGTGTFSYNSNNYGYQFADFGATTYNWSSMPNSLSANNTALGTLMYHCGVGVAMDYGPTSSGAHMLQATAGFGPCAQQAYASYFSYDGAAIHGVWQFDYSTNDWITLLKSELNEGRPVQYQGCSAQGCHSWVCDGYDANSFFHMNWGWGGSYNGYFSLSNLNPNPYVFSSNDGALIGLQPYYGARIVTSFSDNSFCAGSSLSVSYSLSGVFSSGNVFTAQLSDVNGSFSSPTSIGTVSNITSGNISCTIPGGTPAGAGYRIRVVSKYPYIVGSINGTNINIGTIAAAISSGPFCAGANINVSYCTSASFNPGNTFTAQLSNASGSFSTYTNIGSLVSNSSGTISATIPAVTGTGYRIRIVSSNPVVTGIDNGSNIGIGMAVPDVWTQKANVGNFNRYYATGFSIGTKGYIGTGFDGTIERNDFWKYDPATNVWTQKANFQGSSRRLAIGFSIGNKGYIGTGVTNGTAKQDFWEYDPISNSWTAKANFGGVARYGATGFSIGTKGYIGTGYDNSTVKNDFWEYSPATNAWIQKASFGGSARISAASFTIGNKGYIGEGYNNASSYYNDFWEYNQNTNAWTRKADFGGTARYAPCGFSIGSKGYFGLGKNGGTFKNDFWEYNPDSNAWVQKGNFKSTARYGVTAFSIGSKGYIGTGYNGGCLNDFWEYEPAPSILTKPVSSSSYCAGASVSVPFITSGTFGTCIADTFTAQLSNASGSFASVSTIGTLVSNASGIINATIPSYTIAGTGYRIRVVSSNPVVTGTDNGSNIGIGMVASDDWTQKASMDGVKRYYASGFSIGAKGYIGTGFDGTNEKKDFWEFDPATNVWTQKSDFGGTARRAAVGFSIGKKGYIGTGVTSGTAKQDFWQFDPDSNVWKQRANFSGVARYSATGFSIGTKGYIGTGYDNSNQIDKNDFWEYDPFSNAWSQKANFSGPARVNAASFSIGSKGYIGSGYNNVVSAYYNDFYEYNQINNTWSQKAAFVGSSRFASCGFSIGSKGYIGLGNNGGTYKNDIWEYDPQTNLWIQKGNFGGTGRYGATAFSIGNKGYIGNGYNGSYQNDFWEYEPETSILTQSISTTTYCGGSSLTVSFAVAGTFGLCNSNIFNAQLSDATGSFSAPSVIGSISGTTDGIISCTIPANVPQGSQYRIRVVSTNPVVTGSNNGNDININNVPVKPGIINGAASICLGAIEAYSVAPVMYASSYKWTVPAGATIQSGQGTTNITVQWVSSGGILKVKTSNSCGSSANRTLTVSTTCRQESKTNEVLPLNCQVFPNPTNDIATLRFVSDKNDSYEVSIADISGKQVISKTGNAVVGINELPIDLSKYEKGVYFLNIVTSEGTQIKKLIRE